MTKTEIEILNEMFREGFTVAIPNGGNKDKACRKMSRQFGWVQRETVCSGVVVHMYRLSREAAQSALNMSPTPD